MDNLRNGFIFQLNKVKIMLNKTNNSSNCSVGTMFKVIVLSVITRLQAPGL